MIDGIGAGFSRTPPARDPVVWEAAQAFEAAFLTEMLKPMGFGAPQTVFGGGAGEVQFASFLRGVHAEGITKAGGIGLAESIYQTLVERQDAP